MSMTLELLPPPPKPRLQRVTSLADLWTVFVRLKGELSPTTHKHYADVGRKFIRFMEGKKLNEQTIVDWALFLQDQELQASTIQYINTKIVAFLRFLKRMRYTHEDLGDIMPKGPKLSYKEPAMFTEEEYEKIKAYCTGRNWCQVHLWLVILGYRTGMSLVDACHLRWCNVHLNDNEPSYIDIHRIKIAHLGEKALCQIPVIPFTDVHQWLLHLKKQEHLNYKRHDGITDFVHQDAPGFYACTYQRIQQDFKNIFLRAGVTGKTYKNLRNSFCSNLVNSGTQMALVCKMTGHNNVEMLLRYLKADRRALQDGLARSYQYSAAQAGIGKGSDPINDL
jgi:site-specific recombinase XerD